jgi:hypothetical protein
LAKVEFARELVVEKLSDANDQAGLCACGCGKPTDARYARGHNRRLRIDEHGRQCGACRRHKPWDEFHVSKTTTYGHVTTCKACTAAKAAAGRVNGQSKRAAQTWQSVKLCECGCGQPTALAANTDPERGYVKGQPVPHRRGHWKRGRVFVDPDRSREARRQWSRKYYAANSDKRREYARAWRVSSGYQRPPGGNLRSNYGISYAQYLQMVTAQCGSCAVCGTVPSADPDAHKKKAKLFVDHDHETEKVRGLLCLSCNLMLGQSGDNPSRLRDGAAYLDEWAASGPF